MQATEQLLLITNFMFGNNQSTTGYTFEYSIPTTTTSYNPIEINKLNTNYSVAIGPNYNTSNMNNSGNLIVEGNVGIGTSNPQSKLEVVGDISFSGTAKIGDYVLPTNAGSAGQVLKYPSSGTTLEWGDSAALCLLVVRMN